MDQRTAYSFETSLTMLMAFRVLGNPINGRQKVMADTTVSRLLPTLRFPVAWRAHPAETISIEKLAELAELNPFHFSRVFKQATGMSPLQFVTRERMLQAQRLIRETSRSLIEIALEVGYTSPSHFAQVFRRMVGLTPTEFRNAL
jgi:AraC-like DNA-binding protein